MYEQLKKGQVIRLEISQTIDGKTYPETIYCIFKSHKFVGESTFLKEIIVEQIIPINEYLKGEKNYTLIERTFTKNDLGNSKLFFELDGHIL